MIENRPPVFADSIIGTGWALLDRLPTGEQSEKMAVLRKGEVVFVGDHEIVRDPVLYKALGAGAEPLPDEDFDTILAEHKAGLEPAEPLDGTPDNAENIVSDVIEKVDLLAGPAKDSPLASFLDEDRKPDACPSCRPYAPCDDHSDQESQCDADQNDRITSLENRLSTLEYFVGMDR